MKFLLSASALLLAAATLPAQAQTPAAAKVVTKDELRVCVNTELDLADRRKAVQARNELNLTEGTAIRAEAAEMSEEMKAAEGNELKMNRFNRKVKAHNERVAAAQAKATAVRNDLEKLNTELVAYNASCGGISYSREDKDEILKERAAAAPKS